MRTFIIATVAALTLPAGAHAAGFINGGFEDGSVNPGGGYLTLGTGSTAIDGWVVTGSSIDYIGGYWEAAEGNRSIDLNGSASGGIQQTFDTITGRAYTVTFSLAGNPDGGPDSKVMSTVATGNLSSTYAFDSSDSTRDDMGWLVYTYDFIAGGPTTTLSFTSALPGAYGAALDLVSVTSNVPEPATWGLMILGFGAVGGAMRRRRATTVRHA